MGCAASDDEASGEGVHLVPREGVHLHDQRDGGDADVDVDQDKKRRDPPDAIERRQARVLDVLDIVLPTPIPRPEIGSILDSFGTGEALR